MSTKIARADVYSTVVEMCANQVAIDPSEICPERHLIADLGMDSLDIVEIQMEMEDQFGITVPDGDLEKMQTVQQVVQYVIDNAEFD